ncbi:MAG: T9SS type A sorting domain-containing protein [Bacteroidia bacterium]
MKLYSLIAFVGLSVSLNAQSADHSGHPHIEKTIPFPHTSSDMDRVLGPDTLGLADYTNFLPQFAPFMTPVFYSYTGGGYLYGNNRDSSNVCAQGYRNLNNAPVRVLGVLMWFGAKESDAGSSPTSKVVVKSWGMSVNSAYNTDSSGTFNNTVMNWTGPASGNNAPDAFADILFANIDTVSSYTYVSFPVPPTYVGDFAVGVDFSTLAPGDTAGLVSDQANDAYNLDYAYHLYQNKWLVSDQLFSPPGPPNYGSGTLDNDIAIWAVIDTAQCYAHYTTTYDSLLNTFNLTVDPYTSAYATGYHWDFGDGSTSTLAAPSHVYAVDSLYNVCMKIYTASGDSCEYCHIIGIDSAGNVIRTSGFTLHVINAGASSVNEIVNDNAMTIAPNPFSSQATITFSREQAKTNIIITDVLGRTVNSAIVSGKQYTIDKGEMKPGIYFVKTIDARNNVCTGKIIVR